MFILDHVKPEEATGKVAQAYSIFPKQVPVPEPLVLMSVSPDLALAQSEAIRHYMNHEKLDAGLLSMIRFVVANEVNYGFCVNFNTQMLKLAGGMSDEEIAALKDDPQNAPLEPEQKEMLLFVLKVVKTPEQVNSADINKLHELGWTDRDIFDAAFHGASMLGPRALYAAFNK
jgi:alkylhydroperoxidase family enzyme